MKPGERRIMSKLVGGELRNQGSRPNSALTN